MNPFAIPLAIKLFALVAFAAGFAWACVSSDYDALLSDQETPLPQPKGGLGRRLEGDPARVLANYQFIGREWRVSRMRSCDAYWFSGRDFGDER